MGQLFQPWPGQQSLPRGGCPLPISAATVVVRQTPTPGSWHLRLPRRVSLRDTRVGPIGKDNEQPPVGESMNGPWSESRDAGNPHVRFDERDLETERHERHRARSRLYPSQSAREIFALWSRSGSGSAGEFVEDEIGAQT